MFKLRLLTSHSPLLKQSVFQHQPSIPLLQDHGRLLDIIKTSFITSSNLSSCDSSTYVRFSNISKILLTWLRSDLAVIFRKTAASSSKRISIIMFFSLLPSTSIFFSSFISLKYVSARVIFRVIQPVIIPCFGKKVSCNPDKYFRILLCTGYYPVYKLIDSIIFMRSHKNIDYILMYSHRSFKEQFK